MKLKRKRHEEAPEPWEIRFTEGCVQGYHIAGMETGDLLNECLLHWVTVKRKYKIDTGIPARVKPFMATVIANKLRDLARRQAAKKRSPEESVLSLDVPLDSEDPVDTLIDIVSSPTAAGEFERGEMRRRLRRAMARLTEGRRVLCYMLANGHSITEIADSLDISRPTVYSEIDRIRKVFEDENLQEFLP